MHNYSPIRHAKTWFWDRNGGLAFSNAQIRETMFEEIEALNNPKQLLKTNY